MDRCLKSRLWFYTKILLGASILGIVLIQIDFSVLETLHINYIALPFMIINMLLMQALRAVRWQNILSAYYNCRIKFTDALQIVFIGRFFSIFTPAQAGDIGRAAYVRNKISLVKGSASLVVDKIYNSSYLFLLLVIALFLLRDEVTVISAHMLVIIAIAAVIGLLIAYFAYGRYKKNIKKLLFYEKVRFLTPATLWISFLTLIFCFTVLLQVLLISWFISVSVEHIISFLAVSIVVIYATFLPITISGIGIREGAAYFLFPLAGVDGSVGVIIFFIGFLVTHVGSAIIGYYFFVTYRPSKRLR